jgi:uncharacterized protein YraI
MGVLLTAVLIAVILFSMVPVASVSAQEPVVLDENKLGTIGPANPQPSYIFTAPGPQSVEIEVLGIAQGMAPQFTVLNQAGALVQAVGNPALQGTVSGVVDLAQPGAYTVQVQSANGVQGQFVLTIRNAAPAVPPTPLLENQPVTGALAGGESLVYSFPANPTQMLVIDLAGIPGAQNVRAELRDANTGEVIAVLGPQLLGSSLTLPPGTTSYLLELTNATPETPPISYTLSLTPQAPTGVAPVATEGVGLPTLPTTGACVLATLNDTPVNVRSTPTSEGENVVGTISQFATYNVIGRNADSSWYQINFDGGIGWVFGQVTRRGGDCSALPVTDTGSGSGGPAATEQATQPAPGSTEQATQPPPGATEQPTQPSNGQGQAQIAGDNETSTEINIKNGNVSHSGNISYPDGDRQDTVFYRVVGFDSVTTSGDVNYTVTCTGPGAEFARVSTTANASGGSPCPRSGTNFHTDDSDQGRLTIYLEGGEGAYVTWTVVLTANN